MKLFVAVSNKWSK